MAAVRRRARPRRVQRESRRGGEHRNTARTGGPAARRSLAAVNINLSLVSHTNVGKTTLMRTLTRQDIGEVADRPHVTEEAESHVLIDTPEGDRLLLWDTPGFG